MPSTPGVPSPTDRPTSSLSRTQRRSAHIAGRDLVIAFDKLEVLSGVSITVRAGQRMAVIGDNGAGKSTLLRLLAGTLDPDSGTVVCTTGRTLVEQELTGFGDDTVQSLRDEALTRAQAAIDELDRAAEALGEPTTPEPDTAATFAYQDALAAAELLDPWNAERRFDDLAASFGADFAPDTPLASLSSGQRYRLRLASALFDPAGTILLDEPSNHLDDAALDRLAELLVAHAGITVLVTHDRWLLDAVATALFDLDPNATGGGELFTGSYADYRVARAKKVKLWKEERTAGLARIEALTERLDNAREKAARASAPGKGSSKHGRETRIANPIAEFSRRLDRARKALLPPPPEPLRFRLDDVPAEPGTTLLAASGLRLGDRTAMTPGDEILLRPGGRLLLRGANGAGKSTLLALLAGRLEPTAGTITRYDSDRVGLLTQEERLDPSLLALSAIARTRGVPYDADELLEAIRATGLMRDADLRRKIGLLSVGQRRRVALLQVLLAKPAVLLLDEPTNHLSVLLVDDLAEALAATRAAVVLVTHDRTLLDTVGDWPTITLTKP